jgi:LuxR family maltose regulon positive regulatory protein
VAAGEPRRLVRTLVEPAAALIQGCARALAAGAGGYPPPSERYLAELDRAARRELGRTGEAPARRPRVPLREPLSDGEAAVLPFLPSELTYAEIAAERYVSVNTVKSQLKAIYRKLGVRSRVAAVERCRELGLLARDVHPHG